MSQPAKILKKEPLPSEEAKWTFLKRITWQDPTGKERIWESAERATRKINAAGERGTVDAVGVMAVLRNPNGDGDELVLQKQFRPPVGRVCIEVPAGLVDEGETLEEAACRELREETGYRGVVEDGGGKRGNGNGVTGMGGSMVMFNDPGFTNTNTAMIHVSIDMSLPENRDPQPQLEPGEFIETFSVPLKDLHSECRRLEKEGYAIDARVGTLAEGVELARRFEVR